MTFIAGSNCIFGLKNLVSFTICLSVQYLQPLHTLPPPSQDKISEEDKKTIEDKCDEVIKWLDANSLGEKEEFDEKQKELEAVCNPIMTKLYEGAGGMPDMGDMGGMGGEGGMPGTGNAPGTGGSGPTIEEVD